MQYDATLSKEYAYWCFEEEKSEKNTKRVNMNLWYKLNCGKQDDMST